MAPVRDQLRPHGSGLPYLPRLRRQRDDSLAACAPTLASESHSTCNGSRTAHDVARGPRRRAAWSCEHCDHEWTARISSRALNGNGCPRCAGQVALPGYRATLAVAHPELYAEIDVREVEQLGIDTLTIHVRSRRALPWQCQRDARHWRTATLASRMNGCVCPTVPRRAGRLRPNAACSSSSADSSRTRSLTPPPARLAGLTISVDSYKRAATSSSPREGSSSSTTGCVNTDPPAGAGLTPTRRLRCSPIGGASSASGSARLARRRSFIAHRGGLASRVGWFNSVVGRDRGRTSREISGATRGVT